MCSSDLLRSAELRVKQAQESLQQTLLSTEAKVAQAQAALQQAEQAKLQVVAKQREAEAAQESVAQKRADWEASQAVAHTAQLRSTLNGVVTKRNLNRGDFADTTAPILEITDGHSLNLIANIPSLEGQRLRIGQKAKITLPDIAERVFEGSVLSMGQVDPQTNLLTVRLGVQNPEGKLRVGQFATASIILEVHPQAVTLPTQAVLTREGKSVVFLFGGDGKAHQQEVQTGAEQEGLIEIREGVKAGAKVIRLGHFEIKDGAKVEEAKPEPEKKEKEPEKEKGGKE